MNLYGELGEEKALAGLLYGVNPKTIVSIPAGENINYGKGVFLNGARTKLLNGKHSNRVVIDLSAYTTASKDITITVNGVDVDVTTTATIADDVASLVADINDDVPNVTAVAGTGTDAGKLTITSDNDSGLTVKVVYDDNDVTSSKATLSSDAVFAGVSVFHQNAFMTSRGFYIPTEAVNVMEKGYIWVALASGVTPVIEGNAYVTADGTFTTESSGNTLVGKFKSGMENGTGTEKLALVSLD